MNCSPFLIGDDNEGYVADTDESKPGRKYSRKDFYNSIFDLRQCDSYDVSRNSGPCNRFRDIFRKLAESKQFLHFIMISILVNMICMGLEHYNQVLKNVRDSIISYVQVFVCLYADIPLIISLLSCWISILLFFTIFSFVFFFGF